MSLDVVRCMVAKKNAKADSIAIQLILLLMKHCITNHFAQAYAFTELLDQNIVQGVNCNPKA